MKKRLLFALMAMCVAVSGYALNQGEFVYTPQGRFQITGDNLNANNKFLDWTGWTVIGEGKTFADLFNTNANGYADGFNSIQCVSTTDSTGVYFKFEPTDAAATYVVSFKMKGAPLDVTQTFIAGDGYKTQTNLVKVAGIAEGVYTYSYTEGEVIANTAEELTENWQTFNYAIQGDGTSRIWFISFTKMAATIEIADLQIAPAMQFADLRQRDAMLKKLNEYKNCYEWPAEKLDDLGYNEIIGNLQAVGDETGQAELDELLETAQEIITEFVNANMDDFLASDASNYLGVYDGSLSGGKNIQKVNKIGDWFCLPSDRGHWMVGENPDMAHFAGNTAWNYGNVNDPIGIYMQQTLDPGAYVFAIEGKGAVRVDPTSSSWTVNEGLDPAWAVAYIVRMVDGVAADTIASVVQDIESRLYTPFILTAKIAESGTYEIGFKAYCKDAYKELKNGSVVYVKDASLWAKTNNKYSKREYAYEENVRTQITTGRDNLTKAAEYLANPDYLWGKAELQACVDSIEGKIAAYEALTQDQIIATFDLDVYQNTTRDSTGLLQYEVYQEATKWIIAANNKFVAVNDTLSSIQAVIDEALTTIDMRLYDYATGKAELLNAIIVAQNVQAIMKRLDYSEENAATIVAANAELKAAIEAFKASIPASAITTIVDIDFEQNAVQDAETELYSVPGAVNKMTFSSWSTDGTGTQPFEKGYWANGEQLWKGYLRVGNGTGTVEFDPTDDGAMDYNILKVACDMYVQGLSGRSVGFFLKYVDAEEQDADVFGLFHNFYNGTNTNNTCNVDISYIWAKSGGSYNNASPADATDSLTANPLEKSHIEVIMDYGMETMYCTISSVNGTTQSEPVELTEIPTKFILQSNYNNSDRRIWFDNLLIQRIKTNDPAGIKNFKTTDKQSTGYYTISGIRVATPTQKGVYITNGKKVVIK